MEIGTPWTRYVNCAMEKFGSTHCISIGPSENSVCCVPKARDEHHFAKVLFDDHVNHNEWCLSTGRPKLLSKTQLWQ